MDSCLLYLIICSVCWGIYPYFDKKSLSIFTYELIFILKILFFFIVGLIYYFLTRDKINVNSIKSNQYLLGLLLVFISSILSIVGLLYFFKSLNNCEKVFKIVVFTFSIPIIITTIISHYVLNEKITLKSFIGIFLVILGLFLTRS